MSDYNYDLSICRNIMVDARYVLFIVDKYAGATRLIQEMKLVHPKRGVSAPNQQKKELKDGKAKNKADKSSIKAPVKAEEY